LIDWLFTVFAMFAMYNILTSSDVNTFEVVFPASDGKAGEYTIALLGWLSHNGFRLHSQIAQ
jgi:hypothetical protein